MFTATTQCNERAPTPTSLKTTTVRNVGTLRQKWDLAKTAPLSDLVDVRRSALRNEASHAPWWAGDRCIFYPGEGGLGCINDHQLSSKDDTWYN